MNYMKAKANSTKGFTGVLVLLVVVVLALAGFVYANKAGLLKMSGPSVPAADNTPIVDTTKVPEQGGVRKVEFVYKVKSITEGQIVLTGQKGDFTLPNNAARVTVYKGPTTESPKVELSELKVGDNVNMEFTPGKTAALFVSSI